MYLCAVKVGSTVQRTSRTTCIESCQRNTVYTKCESHCEGMFIYSAAVRNKRPNSLEVVQKLSGLSIKNKEMFSKGYAIWERVM